METFKEKLLDAIGFIINPIAFYFLSKNYLKYEIASEVLITSEWTEIIPQSPLKTVKRLQRICLEIECEQNDDQEEDIWYLADGTAIDPQIEIVDEFGNVYQLEGRNASVIPKGEGVLIASRICSYHLGKLPTDRNYTKIRIRNDQTFLCPKIVWVDYERK